MTDQPTDEQRIAELTQEYHDLLHAVQSGVAAEMELTDAHTPKHLRTGVNSSLVNSSALGRLLIHKGLITEVEYVEALCVGMRDEVAVYEQRLSKHYGRTIHLG
jgi:hypothetical protein